MIIHDREFLISLNTFYSAEIDASELEYISSAGLRVLLKLSKAVGDVTVCSVSPGVYEILDITGMSAEMCLQVGNMFFMKYTGITDPEQLKEYYQMLVLLFAFNTVMICGSGASKARVLAPMLMDKLLRGVVIPNEQTIKYLFKTM